MITLLPHQLRASAELDAILRAHRIAYLAGQVQLAKHWELKVDQALATRKA